MNYCILTRSQKVTAGKANTYFIQNLRNTAPISTTIIRYEDSEMGKWDNFIEKVKNGVRIYKYDKIFIADDSDLLCRDIKDGIVNFGVEIDNFNDSTRCIPLEYIS